MKMESDVLAKVKELETETAFMLVSDKELTDADYLKLIENKAKIQALNWVTNMSQEI